MEQILTDRQVKEFYETGYVIIPALFTIDEIEELRQGFDRLVEAAQGLNGMVIHKGSQFVTATIEEDGQTRTQIKRVVWCGAAEPVFLKYGQDRRLTALAGQLMQCNEMNQLINQAHFKMPNDGVFFPFHQDSLHRGYGTDAWRDINGKGSYVQIVMGIDEVTMENGPMQFIPGSCRNGHLGLPYSETEQTVSPLFSEADAIPVLMQPGDIAAFGPYTIHGSLPNISDSSRRVFINGFAYPGANSRTYPGEGSGCLISLS